MAAPNGLLIGVDGGGTKTDICLAREDETVVRRRTLPSMKRGCMDREGNIWRILTAS